MKREQYIFHGSSLNATPSRSDLVILKIQARVELKIEVDPSEIEVPSKCLWPAIRKNLAQLKFYTVYTHEKHMQNRESARPELGSPRLANVVIWKTRKIDEAEWSLYLMLYPIYIGD